MSATSARRLLWIALSGLLIGVPGVGWIWLGTGRIRANLPEPENFSKLTG